MTKNIISLLLLIGSVLLSLKHGWDTLNYKDDPQAVKMMSELGIGEAFIPFFGVLAILVAVLLSLPKTFFAGNVLNATLILFIMALALRAGNFKIVLMEIPFLLVPLIMIWLKYPFKN